MVVPLANAPDLSGPPTTTTGGTQPVRTSATSSQTPAPNLQSSSPQLYDILNSALAGTIDPMLLNIQGMQNQQGYAGQEYQNQLAQLQQQYGFQQQQFGLTGQQYALQGTELQQRAAQE